MTTRKIMETRVEAHVQDAANRIKRTHQFNWAAFLRMQIIAKIEEIDGKPLTKPKGDQE